MDGRKVYVNDWLEEIIADINFNMKINKEYAEKYPDGNYLSYVYRDEKLLDKIEKYKKVDNEGHIYFYFFPNELESLMWVMIENITLMGGVRNAI